MTADERLEKLTRAFEAADSAYLFGPPLRRDLLDARDDARSALARGVRTLTGGRWDRPGHDLTYALDPYGSLQILPIRPSCRVPSSASKPLRPSPTPAPSTPGWREQIAGYYKAQVGGPVV